MAILSISFTNTSIPDYYEYQYKLSTDTGYTSESTQFTTTNVSPISISGLLDSQMYDVQLRSVCGTVKGNWVTYGDGTITCGPAPSSTPSMTPSISITPSITPSHTVTPSITPSHTMAPSITPSMTPSITVTPSMTPSFTLTPSMTLTPTPTSTFLPLHIFMINNSASASITSLVVSGNLAYGTPVTAGNAATSSIYIYGGAIDVHLTGSIGQRITIEDTTLIFSTCQNTDTNGAAVYTFAGIVQKMGGHITITIEDTSCP